MNFHMVMEVIQNRIPAPTMVRIPGTHPKTLKVSLLVLAYEFCKEYKHTRATMSEPLLQDRPGLRQAAKQPSATTLSGA
jgi:hypothetical protein